MIDREVVERLDSEIDRLRTKYDPKTATDLERIAKDEYGAKEVINTPLTISIMGTSFTFSKSGELYIVYYASFKPFEPLALSHEIGHIAAGHFNEHRPESSVREEEANYFATGLIGVSLSKLHLYCFVDAVASEKDHVLNLFRRRREIKRLTQMGVYHLIE